MNEVFQPANPITKLKYTHNCPLFSSNLLLFCFPSFFREDESDGQPSNSANSFILVHDAEFLNFKLFLGNYCALFYEKILTLTSLFYYVSWKHWAALIKLKSFFFYYIFLISNISLLYPVLNLCWTLNYSTPFELHDDSYVLKAMRFCEREPNDGAREPSSNGGECSSTVGMHQNQIPQTTRSNLTGKLPASPPIPGILKGRVKHEHWSVKLKLCMLFRGRVYFCFLFIISV